MISRKRDPLIILRCEVQGRVLMGMHGNLRMTLVQQTGARRGLDNICIEETMLRINIPVEYPS